MRQKMKILIRASITVFLIGFWMVPFAGTLQSVYAFTLIPQQAVAMVRPTVTITPTTTTGAGGGLDSTLLAALIGVGGVFIGLLASIFITIYQTRQNERIQRELARKNELLQRELLQAQKDLEREHTLMEQQEQQERVIANAEAKQQRMLRASTDKERAQLYRDALQNDPHIAILQILDMKRPLEIVNIYVQLRVHQGTQQEYNIDSLQQGIVAGRNPNDVLQTERQRREQQLIRAVDPEEAIHQYNRCIILGDPGAGKTTLLKYLTLTSAKRSLEERSDLLPIYIELNAFVSSHVSDLLDYIAITWDRLYAFPSERARIYVANQLDEGKALLLLDALDETVVGDTTEVAERAYSEVSRIILQIATRYPKASIVVTVRKAGYRQRAPLAGFTELEVIDFRPEDIQQFVKNWYAYSQDLYRQGKCDDLIQRLEQNQRLQTLATNPLLLTLIVLVYEAQLDLPERRAELYKQCVETLLTKWDAKRNIRRRREFKPEHKRLLLEVVAWHYHAKGHRYFPERDLLHVIADFLPAVGLSSEEHTHILQEIANEQGLLKEQAQGWYGFLHLTLQEYFTALYAADYNQLQELLLHRGDPWWEEVILLYAGHLPDASLFLQTLLGQNSEQPLKDDIFCTDLVLAGRCLATRPTIWQTSLREEVVFRLIHILKNTKYPSTRRNIIDTLIEIGGLVIFTNLLHMLADEHLDVKVRGDIAHAIGQLKEQAVVPELMRMLADEHLDVKVRGDIADAIGQLKEQAVVPELIHMLADEHLDVKVRGNIAHTIGQLKEQAILPELMRMLVDEHLDVRVRGDIVYTIGRLGEQAILPELMRMLADDSLNTLVKVSLRSSDDSYGIRSQMNIRVGIVTVIEKLGGRSAVLELVHLLSDEHLDADVHACIAMTVGKQRERSMIPELIRLLADARVSSLLRWLIAAEVGNLGGRLVAPDLVRLLADKNMDVQVCENIARVVGRLEEHSIVPDLVHLLADEHLNIRIRVEIAIAIGRLAEDEVTVRRLVNYLNVSNDVEHIYNALWSVSRRAGVRIFINYGSDGKEAVEVVKW